MHLRGNDLGFCNGHYFVCLNITRKLAAPSLPKNTTTKNRLEGMRVKKQTVWHERKWVKEKLIYLEKETGSSDKKKMAEKREAGKINRRREERWKYTCKLAISICGTQWVGLGRVRAGDLWKNGRSKWKKKKERKAQKRSQGQR